MYKHHRLFAAKGLNEKRFDRLMVHVHETMVQCNVPKDAISEIIPRLQSLRQVFQAGTSTFTKMDDTSTSIAGEAAVDAAMEEFVWHISEDKDLREILEGYDVDQIREHQRRFFRMALRGFPDTINVQKYLKGKHSHLFARGLSVRHFDVLVCCFLDTLQSLRVEHSTIAKAKEFLKVAREAFHVDGEGAEVEKASWRSIGWLDASEL